MYPSVKRELEKDISQSINRTKIIEYVELLKQMGVTIYETPGIPIATEHVDEPLIPIAARHADEPLIAIERPLISEEITEGERFNA